MCGLTRKADKDKKTQKTVLIIVGIASALAIIWAISPLGNPHDVPKTAPARSTFSSYKDNSWYNTTYVIVPDVTNGTKYTYSPSSGPLPANLKGQGFSYLIHAAKLASEQSYRYINLKSEEKYPIVGNIGQIEQEIPYEFGTTVFSPLLLASPATDYDYVDWTLHFSKDVATNFYNLANPSVGGIFQGSSIYNTTFLMGIGKLVIESNLLDKSKSYTTKIFAYPNSVLGSFNATSISEIAHIITAQQTYDRLINSPKSLR